MPQKPRSRNEALVTWVRGMCGPGRQFASARKWSIRAGLSPSVVSSIEESGSASCNTLIALARAANVSPLYVLQISEHLTAAECDPAQAGQRLTDRERLLLQRYRLANDAMRDAVDIVLSQSLETDQAPGPENPGPA